MSEDQTEAINTKLSLEKEELIDIIEKLDNISPQNSDDDVEMINENQYDQQEYYIYQLQQKEDALSSLDQISVKNLESIFIKFCKVSFNLDGLSQDRSFSLFAEGLYFEQNLVNFENMKEEDI